MREGRRGQLNTYLEREIGVGSERKRERERETERERTTERVRRQLVQERNGKKQKSENNSSK